MRRGVRSLPTLDRDEQDGLAGQRVSGSARAGTSGDQHR
jgi:hypothetical protein